MYLQGLVALDSSRQSPVHFSTRNGREARVYFQINVKITFQKISLDSRRKGNKKSEPARLRQSARLKSVVLRHSAPFIFIRLVSSDSISVTGKFAYKLPPYTHCNTSRSRMLWISVIPVMKLRQHFHSRYLEE